MIRLVSLSIRPVRAFGAILCLFLTSAAFAVPFQINETFDVDPLWEAVDNMTGDNVFGFSNTNTTGAASGPGEIGGQISRDPRGTYADDIGTLDASHDAMSMSGTMWTHIDANNDGEAYLGWFDTDGLGGDSAPKNFLGLRIINDPPYEVRLFWQTNSSFDNIDAAQYGNGIADSTPFEFDFSYDPAANGGDGRMTGTVGSHAPVVLDLPPGAKDALTSFNRFGFISSNSPGSHKWTQVFVDDISYTSNIPEPASAILVGFAFMTLGLLRRTRSKQ